LSHAITFAFLQLLCFVIEILFSMDDHNKPSRRKPAKTSLPSASEKEALTTALNSELPQLVQPAPLEPAKVFAPSVKDLGTPTPSFDASSNVAASSAAYPDEGYNHGDRYGGYQATRYQRRMAISHSGVSS
jgi:hypothetical protein